MKIDRSIELLARAREVIPSATQTFSKGPNQWARGVSPHFLERGEGAWVWDVDGNRYLDWLMALGPVILGYRDEAVDAAVIRQVHDGPVFSQMHPLEVEVAERLVELVPCAEMVRFAKNGSDATTAAVRAARAYTGRDVIVCTGYHGWHDWFIGTTTRSLGVPEATAALTRAAAFGDIEPLAELLSGNQVAAIIMEPIAAGEPPAGYLQAVRELTAEHGTLLIFDEIVTGFRVAVGGAQERYGVTPDLACLGKAMANGYPLSAVAGSRDVMAVFDDIFFSGTFGGEAISLAACAATLDRIVTDDVIDHLWKVGASLVNGIDERIVANGLGGVVATAGIGPRSFLTFPGVDDEEARVRRTFVMQECVQRGLLYFCSHVPTAAHGAAEVDFTIDVLDVAFAELAAAVGDPGGVGARLVAEVVEPIFRKP